MIWLVMLTLVAAPPLTPIEDFDRQQPGSGWPEWGPPAGPAAARSELEVVLGDRGMAGRLTYQQAHHHVMLPAPARRIDGLPTALHLRVRGDGSGNRLSVTLRDSSGEWLHSFPATLDFTGWRSLRVDLTRFADVAHGNGDGLPDPPVELLSLNLAFVGRPDGELWFDDLKVETQPVSELAYLAIEAASGARYPLHRLGESAPLALVNRYHSSLEVSLSCRTGERVQRFSLLPRPHGRETFRLSLTEPGAQTVEITLSTAAGQRVERVPLVVLPPRLGGADRFSGIGGITATDIGRPELLETLALCHAVGADWTRWSLPAGDDPAADLLDWRAVRTALTIAWAQELRVAVQVDNPSGHPVTPAGLASLVGQLGREPAAWLLPAGPDIELAALRAVLPADRAMVLTGPLAGSGAGRALADGVVLPVPRTTSASAGGPRAWGAFTAAAAAAAGAPVWFYSEVWPLEALTGLADPGAAMAVAMICARATPTVVAAGMGRELGAERGVIRPAMLALAVADSLVGGLDCRGLRSLAADVWAVDFAAAEQRVTVIWSEGAGREVPAPGAVAIYDHLGRRLPLTGAVTAHAAPIYVVGSPESESPPDS